MNLLLRNSDDFYFKELRNYNFLKLETVFIEKV